MSANVTKEPVTLEEINQILNAASESGADMEEFEGVLNDNYIIYGADGIKIGDDEPTEFIIILAEYASAWSNYLYMIRTNDYKVVEHYDELFND